MLRMKLLNTVAAIVIMNSFYASAVNSMEDRGIASGSIARRTVGGVMMPQARRNVALLTQAELDAVRTNADGSQYQYRRPSIHAPDYPLFSGIGNSWKAYGDTQFRDILDNPKSLPIDRLSAFNRLSYLAENDICFTRHPERLSRAKNEQDVGIIRWLANIT